MGRSEPWQTSSPTLYKSSSAASDVSVPPFGLRIIRAMQPSVAKDSSVGQRARRTLVGNAIAQGRDAASSGFQLHRDVDRIYQGVPQRVPRRSEIGGCRSKLLRRR